LEFQPKVLPIFSGIFDNDYSIRRDKIFRFKEGAAASNFLKNGKEITCLRTKNSPSP